MMYFHPRKSYRSVATLSQGRAGKDKGRSGSLGVGCSLAHVWHRVINSPICVESPGACFSKVPIINGPGKLSPFSLKIEVSIVLHVT